MIYILHQIFSGDKIKKKILGRSYNTYGKGMVYTWYWWGSLMEKGQLEDPGLDEETILKCITRKWFGRMYWIELAQIRDRRCDLVNAVMNLTVP